MINWSIFFRSALSPLIIWGIMVGLVTLSGQPGVVCITPMAWLLALWCGTNYIRLSGGQAGRRLLLGPALAGGLLGVGEGVIFAMGVGSSMPLSSPEDVFKAQLLTVVVIAAGIIICAGLSTFTAWLSLKRLAR